jgi:hypothetical protein
MDKQDRDATDSCEEAKRPQPDLNFAWDFEVAFCKNKLPSALPRATAKATTWSVTLHHGTKPCDEEVVRPRLGPVTMHGSRWGIIWLSVASIVSSLQGGLWGAVGSREATKILPEEPPDIPDGGPTEPSSSLPSDSLSASWLDEACTCPRR